MNVTHKLLKSKTICRYNCRHLPKIAPSNEGSRAIADGSSAAVRQLLSTQISFGFPLAVFKYVYTNLSFVELIDVKVIEQSLLVGN